MQSALSKIVRHCRKKSGLTQLQLAQIAGVGKTTIYDIEKGKHSVQLDTLQKILNILNIQIQFIPPFPISDEEKK